MEAKNERYIEQHIKEAKESDNESSNKSVSSENSSVESEQNDDGIECLYDEIDVSVHGSPVYEYNFITSDKDKVELFKCLQRAYFLID